MPTTDVALVEFTAIPALDAAVPIQPTWLFLVQDNVSGAVWRATSTQAQAALVPVVVALPIPAAATFADFADTTTGGSVRLVPATGVPIGDYRFKIGTDGSYAPAPPDGVITVGNVSGQVFAYAVATATRQQSPTASSPAFSAYVPPAAPSQQVTTPAAPSFANFRDTNAGGTVQLVPADSVLMADYRYKVGADGIYAAVPPDGIISVGNIDGQVFAYSVAVAGRNASATAASASFTSYTATPTGTATPAAPTFASFLDTNAGGSVQIIAADGVPMSDYQYKVASDGLYQPTPADGLITVGNISGPVYAYSVANGSRNQSPIGLSQAFTAYVAPAALSVPGAPTNANAGSSGSNIAVGCFTPASNGGSPITGYNIYRNGNPSPLALNVQLSYANYLDTTAVAGTAYSYTLAAINSVGAGPQSGPSNTVTIPLPVVVAPVITTYSYTTSAADYAAKCGAGTTGTAVTKTSTLSLADATSQAIAAITCPIVAAVTAISYHGLVNGTTPLPQEVQALTKETWAFAPRTIVYTASGTYPAFAEPQSYGTRNVIQDVNGFDVTADITIFATSYLVNGVNVPYYRYVHNNPQYDPAFTLKFL